MTSTGFVVNNVSYPTPTDVYDIFEIYVSGTKALATGYVANNANYPVATDLCNIFAAAGKSGVSATGLVANNSNYTTAKDLNAIFCPAMYFKANGTTYRWNRNNDCSLNTIYGYPPPSIYADNGRWCYINMTRVISGFTTFKRYRISLDMYVKFNSLSNICFGCNTSGNGTAFRCEVRGGSNYSGINTSTGWYIDAPTSADGVSLTGNTWHNILISVYDNGYCNYVYDGILWQKKFNFADTGTYLGYSGQLDGGYAQNIFLTQTIFDGTFTNWTNNGAIIDWNTWSYNYNYPAGEPAICLPEQPVIPTYFTVYRNISSLVPGLTTFKGCKIVLQMYISSQNCWFSFMFGCNSSGNGTRITFDGNPNVNASYTGITSCSAWSSGYNEISDTKPLFNYGIWYLIDITIGNSNSITYTVNGGTIYTATNTLSDNGTYIGLYGNHPDNMGGGAGYFKNINVFRSIFDGTFTGWINNGATISSTVPAGTNDYTINCNGGGVYCFTDAATVIPNLVNFLGYVVTFDMYISGQYLNVHIGVDSGGAGTFFRLETRSDRWSGIAQISGWTGFYGFPSGVAPSTALEWHKMCLYIKNDNTIEYTIDDGSVNTYNAYTNNGTYFGISTGGQAGYVRNIYIYKRNLIIP